MNWMNHGDEMHLVQPIHLLDSFQVFGLNFMQFVSPTLFIAKQHFIGILSFLLDVRS